MIIHYVDSCAWIKRYCLEVGSEWMNEFFARCPTVGCSALGLIEILSTLARKTKTRELQIVAFHEKSREAQRDFELFYQVYLTPHLLKIARKLSEEHALRGADTVHLASIIFLRNQFAGWKAEVRMVTCDAELCAAARDNGFAVINPEAEVGEKAPRRQP